MSVFVDTNVLVYARDTRDPGKQRQARAWIEYLWSSREGRLSAQVLNEYYVTVTRRLAPGLPPAEARADIERFTTWNPLPVDASLIESAIVLGMARHISHWDALIVAAARRADCAFLLTEDLTDGDRVETLTVISPFTNSPPAPGEPAAPGRAGR